MARKFFHYHLGRRVIYLDADSIIYFKSDNKCIVAFTADSEITLDHGETIKGLLVEFAGDFIQINRGTLVRLSSIVYIDKARRSPSIYYGARVWVTDVELPLRACRRRIKQLLEVELLTKGYKGRYENNTGAKTTIKEGKPSAAHGVKTNSAARMAV